jgi:vacuolar-type H+-ATPase subunit H
MQTLMRAQEDIKSTLGNMPEHIENSAKAAATLLKESRDMLMQIGQHASESMVRAFGESVGFTKQELSDMRRGIQEDASQQAQALLALNAESYREAVLPVAESLTRVSAQLGQIIQDGTRLQELQNALNDNLNSVGKADRLDQTMAEVRSSLASLTPILEKLTRPVPLRLTLGGVELADGGGQTSVVYPSGEKPRPIV